MNELLEMINFLGELDSDMHNDMTPLEVIALRDRIHRYKDRLESEVDSFEESIADTHRFYSLTKEASDTIL